MAAVQTLSDPERRAAYDTLMGFHADSVNPFRERAIPLDQVCSHCVLACCSIAALHVRMQAVCTSGALHTFVHMYWHCKLSAEALRAVRGVCAGCRSLWMSTRA